LWTRLEFSPHPAELEILRQEGIDLDRRFAMWDNSRIAEFSSAKVGDIRQGRCRVECEVGYWPGRVDTYFDLYVAGVWNVYRAARLLLINIILRLSDGHTPKRSRSDYIKIANLIADDMAASIPYHLVENLPFFVRNQHVNREISDPGKLLGGLVLMHPLYVASRMPYISEDLRDYMQRCLLWIGSNMGIGQATILAKVRPPYHFFKSNTG
jgi:hypothetical protein